MKRALVWMLSVALVLGLVATWAAPHAILYWATPPVPMGGCDCTLSLQWGLRRMVLTQAAGIAVGALIGAILAFVFRTKVVAAPPAAAIPTAAAVPPAPAAKPGASKQV